MHPVSAPPQPSGRPPRRAPPVGRVLRFLLGLVLLARVTPVYFGVHRRLALDAVLLMLGLLLMYSLLHVALSRRLIAPSAALGAIGGLAILVVVYLAGATGIPVLGHGAGELAAVTFLGVSLLVAALRADPGCEVMAIPGLLFRRRAELACLIFSPLDAWERNWRNRGAA